MRSARTSLVRGVALLAALMLAAAACGGDGTDDDTTTTVASESTGSAEEGNASEPGAVEDADITIAIPFPDITMYSMYLVGSAQGYYEEEGLTVEVITADDVVAAVASGSADVGVESAGSVIEAIRSEVPVTPLSGHFCRSSYDFAVQPEIETVEDLDGTEIVLAGTAGDPAQFERQRVLAEEGWDISEVEVEVVFPGPDSAAWREFFIADRVTLIPFFGDDRPALEEDGAKIIVETIRNWPNDIHVTSEEWLNENPNSAIRFLRATMRSVQFIMAPGLGEVPENKDEVLDIYEAEGFEVDALREQNDAFVLDGHFMCENLYYGEGAWETTVEVQSLDPISFTEQVGELPALDTAQELLGLDNEAPADVDYRN